MGQITIKQGNITQEAVDVIVNAANTTLRGGGGVDGAIHQAGGKAILDECIKIGGCATGEAVITGGGNLKAKKVIHAVGPVWNGGGRGEAKILRNCYEKSFELAIKNKLRTIAFPAIGTGAYGYPIEQATQIALEEGLKFKNNFTEIRYICFSAHDAEIYHRIFNRLVDNDEEMKG